MSDNFTGRWLVTEYVYNSDGSFAGIVHQKRHVERVNDSRLTVFQDCAPTPELDKHPMQHFKGKWKFDLLINEGQRQYIGEDVVGTGFPFGDKAMIGQGVWTNFGYNFTSFGFLPTPTRQLTGGSFFTVNHMIARIVGVAIPERDDALEEFPHLEQSTSAQDIASEWHGQLQRYDADGVLIHESDIVCEITQTQTIFRDKSSLETTLILNHKSENNMLTGTVFRDNQEIACFGKWRQYGCLGDEILYSSDGLKIESQTILDADTQTMIIMQKWQVAHNTPTYDILLLSANTKNS